MKPLSESVIIPDAVDPRTAAPGKDVQRRQIRSTDLFGDRREVLIEHAGEFYLLRQTSKGKLILTK
jgi:hemin uptake protein HemP